MPSAPHNPRGPTSPWRRDVVVVVVYLWVTLLCVSGAWEKEEEDNRVWTERTHLALDTPAIPSCDDHNQHNKCFHKAPQPMAWNDAHIYCRGRDGFLASRDEHQHLAHLWSHPTNLTWTALTSYQGHYQWISRCPAPSDFVSWRELPELWDRDCAAFDVYLQEFQLYACADKLPFYCVLRKHIHPQDDVSEDLSDVELRVERSSLGLGHHGWLSLNQTDFLSLTLSCRAYSKSTGRLLPYQPHVFWKKDLVYTSHCVGDMMPATIHDSTKSESVTVMPGVRERQQEPIIINQGTYWCEAWLPGSPDRFTSNKVLVTHDDWLVFILNAHKYEPPGVTINQTETQLRSVFKEEFHRISDYIMDVISVEKKEEADSSYVRANYSFHLHVPRNEFIMDVKNLQFKSEEYQRIFSDHKFESSSTVAYPTFCSRQTKSFNTGLELEWPFEKAGEVHPNNFKCKVNYGKLSPGRCVWDYIHGAQLNFDPSGCEWMDQCPVGYTSIQNKYCVAVSAPATWTKGFSDAFRTSQERSVLDSRKFFRVRTNGVPPVYDQIRQLVARTMNETKIWLPSRRLRRLSPIKSMSPSQKHDVYQDYEAFKMYNISWAPQHPRSSLECLALDMATNQLQTEDCNAHLPFVTIINAFFLGRDPKFLSGSLVKSSPLCPSGWSTTKFKNNTSNIICFKLFMNQRNLTWPEANKFCEEEGEEGQLPTPNVGFLDWVYRRHLYNHNVSDVWMGAQWIHERLLYNGSVDNINWLADTDYTNRYGALTQYGWILEKKEVTKQNVLCQKRIHSEVSLRLEVHEPKTSVSQTMCIDVDPEQFLLDGDNNLRCYVNGVYTKHEQTQDSGCQYEMKVSHQGYYQCIAWAHPPLTLVYSNPILHRDYRTFTFVVTLLQDKKYKPKDHDSTFKINRFKMPKPSSTCTEQFRNRLDSSDLANDYRFSFRNFFYLPEHTENKLLPNFHLECELKKDDAVLSEKQLFMKLNNVLTTGEQFSDCKLIGIRSTVGCPKEVTRNYGAVSPGNLTWPATRGNSVVIPDELCITHKGEPVTRECLGDFVEGYYWGPAGNCTEEPSELTRSLWRIKRNPKDYLKTSRPRPALHSLVEITKNSSWLQPIDIHLVAKTFESFSRENESNIVDLEEIVETLNNIMAANTSIFDLVQKKLNSSGILLEAFEDITFQIELPSEKGDQKKNSSKEFISVERLDLEVNSTIVGYKSREDGEGGRRAETLVKGVALQDLKDADAAIIFPSNLTYTIAAKTARKGKSRLFEEEKVPLTFAVYRNEKLFQDNVSLINYTVNSRIILASFKGETIKDLDYPVTIYFKPFQSGNDTKCVFWDFTKNSGRGGWSEEGCRKGERVGVHDVCLCNHLTSFAQLINYNDDSGFSSPNQLALDIITIIGCCLSIIGLLLVFTTFFLFKKWRRSLSNKILVNLSFSVFCSVVIFLAGINQTWNLILCRGVAVGLHYFILASFGWMLVEAVHQYLKFVKVFGTYIPRFLWKASVCAWGIPLLPILTLLVYDSSLYDSNNDYNGDAKICWMSAKGFKFAFLPPLIATMTVNLIIFSKIIHGAVCGRARVTSTMSERVLFMNQLRMAVCVFFLLGFTWIFGLLAVCQIRIVFSYLFCIFNTLQGFFLFLFHVFRERSARKYWRDFLSVLTQDPMSSTPGNSVNLPNSAQFREHHDSVTFDKCGGILVLPQGPVRPQLRRTVRTSLLSARTASTLVHSRVSFNP
ncbi:uncharacterized protein LOC121862116 isoform X2 [Homarus americanus]|uniref:uncharacterized protein LOC121862116 isoform X2 n=1 Tax=Homarus americanus TaxID=6706 RepID=UPI001C47909A|nr:uncharacterized protein LOC121862116 isoform X2 [Homarus americanus]